MNQNFKHYNTKLSLNKRDRELTIKIIKIMKGETKLELTKQIIQLIKDGEDVNQTNKYGMTPLHLSC